MTVPSANRDDATVRGAVVLVVAIVIGLALLARSGGGGGGDEDASTDETTESTAVSTTAAAGDSTTVPIDGPTTTTAPPTEDTRLPAEVTVAVINATETVDWAADNADILTAAGYMTATGNPAGDNADISMIYATPEALADAQAVARLLSLESAQVDAKPAEPLAGNGSDTDADVVVVLGADSVAG